MWRPKARDEHEQEARDEHGPETRDEHEPETRTSDEPETGLTSGREAASTSEVASENMTGAEAPSNGGLEINRESAPRNLEQPKVSQPRQRLTAIRRRRRRVRN